jgi:hypothetical protein
LTILNRRSAQSSCILISMGGLLFLRRKGGRDWEERRDGEGKLLSG